MLVHDIVSEAGQKPLLPGWCASTSTTKRVIVPSSPCNPSLPRADIGWMHERPWRGVSGHVASVLKGAKRTMVSTLSLCPSPAQINAHGWV